ncbi:MAG TPA: DUF72 domain-containing protein [Candidatus Aquilonibacter sp.]|nr:DUF72 domain-containing protein [Candidatus Aquilonibacter sp.]
MIYVGTCGYSYKEWIGSFYSPTIRPDEMLASYASHFTAVEIDSSYYRVPSASTVAAMNRRTPPTFRFSFKAPQSVMRPKDLSGPVHDDARLLADVIAPLLENGKLACVLLQFPNGFRRMPRNEAYLMRVMSMFDAFPLVVEFRSDDWQVPETIDLLAANGASLCNVDLPDLPGLPHPSSDVVGPIGYVRFHGRNARQWWTGSNVTRYDYSYRAQELAPWTERLAEIDAQVKESYAFFNNHARGNAPRNAELFEELLRERFGMLWQSVVARPPAGTRMPEAPSLFEK